MSITEILAKAIAGEELTDEEKESLQNYQEPDVEGIVKSRLAREQKKHSKSVEDLQAKLDELQEQLEEKEEAGTSTEQVEKKISKLEEKLAKKDEELAAKIAELGNLKKSTALNTVKSQLDLVKGYDQKYVDFVLSQMTSDMEPDDITESADELAKSFSEANQHLIKAPGSGSGISDGAKPTQRTTKFTPEQIAAMSPAEILKYDKEIKAQIVEEKLKR